jgi:hypothetical protein
VEQLLHALAQDLNERGGLDLSECFIDGTFAPAQEGACRGEDQARQRAKIMAVADRAGLPATGTAGTWPGR